MKRRIFFVCALLIMSIFVFVACNNNNDGKVTTTTTTGAETTTGTPAESAEDRLQTEASEFGDDLTSMMTTTTEAS